MLHQCTEVCHRVSLQCVHECYLFLTSIYGKNSSHLTVLSSHYFPTHYLPQVGHLSYLGMSFLVAFYRSLCAVGSAIVAQLFHLTIIKFLVVKVPLHCWNQRMNSHDCNRSQCRFLSYDVVCHVNLFSGPHCVQDHCNYTLLMGVMCRSGKTRLHTVISHHL